MRIPRNQLLVAALLAIAFGLSGFAFAQSDLVRITGEVLDESGDAIEGATVVTEPAKGETRPGFRATTNKKGRFTAAGVSAGQFDVSVDGYSIVYIEMKPMGGGTLASASAFESTLAPGEPPASIYWQPGGRYKLTLRVTKQQAAATAGLTGLAAANSSKLKALNDLFEMQDWDALIVDAESAIAESPDLGGAYYLLGVARWQTGEIGAAVESIRKAAELLPDQPGIQGTLGTLLLTLGAQKRDDGDEYGAVDAYAEAAELFASQLEETPGSVVYATNRVAALDFAGQTDDLIPALEELLAIDPENTNAYLRLAELHIAAGNVDDGIAVLDRMPSGGESAAAILYNAAVEMWNDGNLEAAVATADKGIEMAPDMPELYRLKAMALISTDQPLSVELLEKYISMVPEDTPGLDADKALLGELKARL